MNIADFLTAAQGFPLASDSTLGFMQTAYQQGIAGLSAWLGSSDRIVIVSGVEETTSGSNVYSDGFIIWNGELLPFTGGIGNSLISRNQTVEQRANQNGVLHDRYFTRYVRFGSGETDANFNTVVRLNNHVQLHDAVLSILRCGTTENVVLRGGEQDGTNINAGLAILGNDLVSFPFYGVGTYPAYLSKEGWSFSQPTAPFIKFDPQCSQYYADVVRRKTAFVGEVRILPSLSDQFDGTGLGRWNMLGWAICNGQNGTIDMRGKTFFGLDAANGFGENATGGAKEVTLTLGNMPTHNHGIGDINTNVVGPGNFGLIRKSVAGENVTISSSVDTIDSGVQPDLLAAPTGIPAQGEYTPIDILNPYRVMVFVQRI
jgi:hypothetical protein